MENEKKTVPTDGTKLEFMARITLPDGRVIEKTVEVEGGIPSPGDFDVTDRYKFLDTFDRYERGVIDARDRLTKSVTEAISDELKKTAVLEE